MVKLLGNIDYWKWKVLSYLGIKPPLNREVLERLKENQTQNKDYIPTPSPNSLKCNYKPCKKRLRGLTYRCHYCHGRFCEIHRLPEDHDCENPSLPSEMSAGYGTKHSLQEASANSQAESN